MKYWDGGLWCEADNLLDLDTRREDLVLLYGGSVLERIGRHL